MLLVCIGILIGMAFAIILIELTSDPNKIEECDHTYWPVMENSVAIGQQCSLCGKFNQLQ